METISNTHSRILVILMFGGGDVVCSRRNTMYECRSVLLGQEQHTGKLGGRSVNEFHEYEMFGQSNTIAVEM